MLASTQELVFLSSPSKEHVKHSGETFFVGVGWSLPSRAPNAGRTNEKHHDLIYTRFFSIQLTLSVGLSGAGGCYLKSESCHLYSLVLSHLFPPNRATW